MLTYCKETTLCCNLTIVIVCTCYSRLLWKRQEKAGNHKKQQKLPLRKYSINWRVNNFNIAFQLHNGRAKLCHSTTAFKPRQERRTFTRHAVFRWNNGFKLRQVSSTNQPEDSGKGHRKRRRFKVQTLFKVSKQLKDASIICLLTTK